MRLIQRSELDGRPEWVKVKLESKIYLEVKGRVFGSVFCKKKLKKCRRRLELSDKNKSEEKFDL